MIVVVEGPSAAGKTTWASQFDTTLVIPENGRITPPPGSTPEDTADFWVEQNCARWQAAAEVERRRGVAVCDTDPLKLHYDYSLARSGVGSWEQFELGRRRCRVAIAEHRLGVADVVVVSIPDDDTLERHRLVDGQRMRRNFDLHRRLSPAIADWYTVLERLDPGRVAWGFPAGLPEPVSRARFDLALYDAWMRGLPRDPL